MKFLSVLLAAGLAGIASAVPQKSAALDVKIVPDGETGLKATITNVGGKDLRLLNVGTILDDAPVQKLAIKTSKGKTPFKGIKKRVTTTGLQDSSFTSLNAGASITVDLDASHAHDLEAGTSYSIASTGRIPYALKDSNNISGSVGFRSNLVKLDIPVHAVIRKASHHLKTYRDKRNSDTQVSDCSADNYQAALQAQTQCAGLANAAADRAATDDAKFKEYFATLDAGARKTVVDRFRAVANECSISPGAGRTTTHCIDEGKYCGDNTLAYTFPDTGYVVDCPMYFATLPPLTSTCHGQDRATTTIHEYTHANSVFPPGTDDLGYGYDAIMQLDSASRINNADTYAMFANAIYANC